MTTPARTRSRPLLVALLAVLLLAPAQAATAHAAPAGADASAGARMLACRHSPSIDQRVAVVGAWMRPLPAGRRMTLRIELQQRQPGGRWTPRTDVPGLGTWTAPSDALLGTRAGDVFRYRQAVGRLVVGSSYRFRVSFRWLDDAGAVVRESALTTGRCRQPGPDLVLTAVRTEPAPFSQGGFLYRVTVRNQGRAAVARGVVAATYPGETTPGLHRHRTGRLAPGASVVLTFTAPGCAAGEAPAAFAADPENLVDEVDEANNQLVAACPVP